LRATGGTDRAPTSFSCFASYRDGAPPSSSDRLQDGRFDVITPTAVTRDVRGPLAGIGLAQKSRDQRPRVEFDLAHPQRGGNGRDERSHLFRRDAPDFQLDARAVLVYTDHSGPVRRAARQGEQAIARRGGGGLNQVGAAISQLMIERQPLHV